MSKGIKILRGVEITNPKSFLPGSLETGIVSFAFGAEFVNVFEVFGFAVNGEYSVIKTTVGSVELDNRCAKTERVVRAVEHPKKSLYNRIYAPRGVNKF